MASLYDVTDREAAFIHAKNRTRMLRLSAGCARGAIPGFTRANGNHDLLPLVFEITR
ncbi:hypothetical protein [Salinisphaera dokdonensis]|uniref:hypothetical protein n=1 Tax=Salinisphaera dokdonensis TaxID=454598 RepID=UPI003341764D